MAQNRDTDFLVIGSGIAALSYALQVAECGKVTIITKSTLADTNTSYAQGGIAAVVEDDKQMRQSHVDDTMECGSQCGEVEVVRSVIEGAGEVVSLLEKWGVKFDRDKHGNYKQAREGGHSQSRILHHKDNTGHEIQQKLIESVRKYRNFGASLCRGPTHPTPLGQTREAFHPRD